MKKLALITLLTALTTTFAAAEQAPEPGDRTAPYFVVSNKDGVDGFPLLKTEAKVNIAGVVANVELTQVYKNNGEKTIEAVYVFPMGTGSAIHAMRMKIEDRIIEAEIQKSEEAKQIYETAKKEGKIASLLEQERPNVFKMNVANIMPGDVVNVTVNYTELLVPEEGLYEFVFPTVVGPRYTGPDGGEVSTGEDWTATPYHKEGEKPSYAFNIEASLNTGIPITSLEVPSHKTKIEKDGGRATVRLDPEERKKGNKDFILRYSLQGNKVHSGLVMYQGEQENFFLLMMEPPKKVDIEMVPPREYIFVVDVSGSMNGFPLEVSKKLIQQMLDGLREKDFFNILYFASGSSALSEKPLPATKENIANAIEKTGQQTGGGGTQILDALEKVSKLEKKEGLSRTIIVATDGYVAVEKRTFDKIRENLNDANFFAFGIGRSVNRYLIEGMARVGNGKPFVVTDDNEAKATAEKFMNYIQYPLLTDISVEFEGFDAYDIEPPALPDLFSQRPLIFFGKYKKASGKIVVKGQTSGGEFKETFKVESSLENRDNNALKYLWARKKLELLSDYASVGAPSKEEVTEIGLKYHLMTAYTSFVAVDKIVRDTGEIVTVKQPLPLPEGVSNLAVGEAGYFMGGAVAKSSMMRSPGNMPVCVDACLAPAAPETVKKPVDKESPKETPKQALTELIISGGTYPAGITSGEAEKIVKDTIGKELKAKFNEWDLTKATISMRIENGEVKEVKVITYSGKTCDEKVVTEIFKKLKFSDKINGTMTLVVM